MSREKALREEAERHVRLSEMFADMLGHDLRNPLGTITMGANYIARANLGEKATRSSTRIANSAERMSRMIDQLLDFTRIRAGNGLELARMRVDLGELLGRVKEELEASNPQCVIGVSVQGDPIGMWDYERLLQVLSNVVGNAISHGAAVRSPDTELHVDVRAFATDSGQVEIQIHNVGAVAPEVLPVMFEPIRTGAKRAHSRGLGLGLYISRQIVLAHGGDVTVSSNDIEGTTILITLPRSPQPSPPATS